MATKKSVTTTKPQNTLNAPQTLDQCTFFKRLSFELGEEQKAFRDAIYDKDNQIVFCNAKAGTGKTTVAVATACAMIEFGIYNKIIYVFAPVGFENVGLLPGTLEDKTAPFIEPIYEALIECGYMPEKCIKQLAADMTNVFVDCQPHTFLRGCNFDNAIVIIDESQNFYLDELKKVLTRTKDSCKVIVMGHDGQCDLYRHPEHSGFVPYLKWFENQPGAKICQLTKNYRGWVSTHADALNVKVLM